MNGALEHLFHKMADACPYLTEVLDEGADWIEVRIASETVRRGRKLSNELARCRISLKEAMWPDEAGQVRTRILASVRDVENDPSGALGDEVVVSPVPSVVLAVMVRGMP